MCGWIKEDHTYNMAERERVWLVEWGSCSIDDKEKCTAAEWGSTHVSQREGTYPCICHPYLYAHSCMTAMCVMPSQSATPPLSVIHVYVSHSAGCTHLCVGNGICMTPMQRGLRLAEWGSYTLMTERLGGKHTT